MEHEFFKPTPIQLRHAQVLMLLQGMKQAVPGGPSPLLPSLSTHQQAMEQSPSPEDQIKSYQLPIE